MSVHFPQKFLHQPATARSRRPIDSHRVSSVVGELTVAAAPFVRQPRPVVIRRDGIVSYSKLGAIKVVPNPEALSRAEQRARDRKAVGIVGFSVALGLVAGSFVSLGYAISGLAMGAWGTLVSYGFFYWPGKIQEDAFERNRSEIQDLNLAWSQALKGKIEYRALPSERQKSEGGDPTRLIRFLQNIPLFFEARHPNHRALLEEAEATLKRLPSDSHFFSLGMMRISQVLLNGFEARKIELAARIFLRVLIEHPHLEAAFGEPLLRTLLSRKMIRLSRRKKKIRTKIEEVVRRFGTLLPADHPELVRVRKSYRLAPDAKPAVTRSPEHPST